MPKPPVYQEREMLAIKNADRVIARVWNGKTWGEQTFMIEAQWGENTVVDTLYRVQHSLERMRDGNVSVNNVMLYVAGQVGEELVSANVPQDYVPQQVLDAWPAQ